jgi:hypothetical protein
MDGETRKRNESIHSFSFSQTPRSRIPAHGVDTIATRPRMAFKQSSIRYTVNTYHRSSLRHQNGLEIVANGFLIGVDHAVKSISQTRRAWNGGYNNTAHRPFERKEIKRYEIQPESATRNHPKTERKID